jgi:hypothetical protein
MLQAPCFDTDKRNRKKIEHWVRRLRTWRRQCSCISTSQAPSNQNMERVEERKNTSKNYGFKEGGGI